MNYESVVEILNEKIKIHKDTKDDLSVKQRSEICKLNSSTCNQDRIADSYMRKQQDIFWYDSAFDFTFDLQDYIKLNTMSEEFNTFLEKTFSLLIPLDNPVIDNNLNRLLKLAKTPEQTGMIIFMAAIEVVHKSTYEKINQVCPWSEDRKNKVTNLYKKYSVFNEFEVFCDTLVQEGSDIDVILFNCCYEGIYALDIILNVLTFNEFNMFHTIISANQTIFIDESLHAEEDCHLALFNGFDKERAYEIIKRFVAYCYRIQKEYFYENMSFLQCTSGEKITLEMRLKHIKFNANVICTMLNIEPLYNNDETQQIEIMTKLKGFRKENFFERKGGIYKSIPGTGASLISNNINYNFDF